jgi:hypothetical protein
VTLQQLVRNQACQPSAFKRWFCCLAHSCRIVAPCSPYDTSPHTSRPCRRFGSRRISATPGMPAPGRRTSSTAGRSATG